MPIKSYLRKDFEMNKAAVLYITHTYIVELNEEELQRYAEGMLELADYYSEDDLNEVFVSDIEYIG